MTPGEMATSVAVLGLLAAGYLACIHAVDCDFIYPPLHMLAAKYGGK